MIEWIVLSFALLVGVVLLVLGLRDPLTMRLGVRNALRHRRQTLTVVLGLMVGTMVVGASLITGDSLEAGLRSSALENLNELDIVVRVPGNLPVPEALFAEVVAEPLPSSIEGTSRILLEAASIEHAAEDLYEPSVAVVGFDPEEDRPFGAFVDASSGERFYGEELGPREVYLNKEVADKLSAVAGSTVTLTYRLTLVPLVPTLHWLNGTLVAASAAPDADGSYTYAHSVNDVYELTFPVERRAERVIGVVLWADPSNSTDLDVELVAPGGASFVEDEGTAAPAAPDPLPPVLPPEVTPETGRENPTFVSVEGDDLAVGEWTLRVHAKAAQNQPFTAFAAVFEPQYDLSAALRFYDSLGEEAQDQPFFEDVDPENLLSAGGLQVNLTVARVVGMEGKGSFFFANTVLMRRDAMQDIYGVPGKVSWLKVTNAGGVEGGLARSDEVEAFLNERLVALREGADPADAESNLQVDAIKREWLEGTEEAATIFTQFLTLIGSFAIVAGVMLIINIFSMLAEERKHELGISRAVGLTRGRLVSVFTFEGSLYTFLSAGLGVVAGMLLSFLLIIGINRLVPEDTEFTVPFTAHPEALALTFGIGTLLTFATVLFASYRASRFHIVRAIRGLPEPPRHGDEVALKVPLGVMGALLVLSVVSFFVDLYLIGVVAPALALFIAGPILFRWLSRQVSWIVASLLVLGYTLLSFVMFPLVAGVQGDVSIAVRGVVLVIAATVLVVHLEGPPRAIARMLSWSRALAPVARVATTYPLHRKGRTGLTLSMYALVILVIVMFSVFFTIFTPDLTRQTGDYEVVADSQIVEADLASVPGLAALAGTDEDPFLGVRRYDALIEHSAFGGEPILIDGEAPESFGDTDIFGYDRPFAENNGFGLDEWDRSLGDDPNDVFVAVLEDPRNVIVSYSLVADHEDPDGKRWHTGSVLTLNTTGGQQDYLIVGIMEQSIFGGVWMGRAELESVHADFEGFYFFDLEPGVDSEAAAKRIERAFRDIGMDADSVETQAREFEQQTERVFQLFQAYLAIGLVVGVASIGIVTSRSVLERRREIGMLKAIGWTRRLVAVAFLIEVLVILFAAAVIGVGLGILVARLIYVAAVQAIPGVMWSIPWGRILEMLGVALLATVLATVVPLVRAGRLAPAEALRTLE